MKVIALLFFMQIFSIIHSYKDHPYFRKSHNVHHKFEKGNIYTQANGQAKGDEGQSNVYSSKNKATARARGSDYSNARVKYSSTDNMAEFGKNDYGWGHQQEFEARAKKQVRNDANAEAHGNASSEVQVTQDDADAFAQGDDFSRSAANFNTEEQQQQQIVERKKRGFHDRLQHLKNHIQDKIGSRSHGKSYGKGHSHSKANRNEAAQNNEGKRKTDSNSLYNQEHSRRHHNRFRDNHHQKWTNDYWRSNDNDNYWDNFY